MTIPKALAPTTSRHGGEFDAALHRLKEKLARAAGDAEGSVRTGTLRVVRRTRRDTIHAAVTEPVAALVVSGAKEARLFDTPVAYGRGSVFVCGVNVPDRFVLSGTTREPFLALAVPISERTAERAIALLEAVWEGADEGPELPSSANDPLPESLSDAAAVLEADTELVVAFERLFDRERECKDPAHDALCELARMEVLVRILKRTGAAALRKLFHANTVEQRIRRSALWMREHYRESFEVEAVAQRFGMSPAAYHRRFREVLSVSPRRYVILLRLFEAKRLMTDEGFDAARASAEVGYASPSHFSRAYKGYFGSSPKADARS